VIPFTLTKALWAYPSPDVPSPYVLWRRSGDGYVTTEHELYYRFWKGIRGQWRRSESSDPDVLCHLVADAQRLSLIVMNIEEEAPRTVVLAGLEELVVDKVALRTLRTNESIPVLQQRTLAALPSELTLAPGESAILLIDVLAAPAATSTEHVTRHYAESYLQDIEADKPVTFQFRDLPTGTGRAVLRLGIGRDHGLSLSPVVTLGGERYQAIADLIGDGQRARPRFFGVVEIPLPRAALTPTAELQVVFPDTGGKVASAVLQIHRTEPDAGERP
jgi:hypothetical protein